MANYRNAHGLSRTIPPDVKFAVRQACGFGCVVCGASIVEYEHIDPEFKDATEHVPNAIALLCPSCHAKVTRKFWSKEKIAQARARPFCKRSGFSWGELDVGPATPVIYFSGMAFEECRIPVEVMGTPLFQVDEPEVDGAPFRLSAAFADSRSQPTLMVVQNEWSVNVGVWDAEFVGGRITLREESGLQSLVVRAVPGGGVAIDRLRMRFGPYFLKGDTETLKVITRPGDGLLPAMTEFTNTMVTGARVGVSLN